MVIMLVGDARYRYDTNMDRHIYICGTHPTCTKLKPCQATDHTSAYDIGHLAFCYSTEESSFTAVEAHICNIPSDGL